ncbi:virulence-associated E family protein [Croceicoccus marinus]|uniref:Virulence-associated E family protein n=1 Tax=Croceicoccus marinus TaxID=450378 RepID=A0A7G6VW84_9SPHN|nr:virulence-associated E family protein [Croceicoccus marinus]QNE05999.1 virulence-associated E family protein [Croceicoccus marinus]
MNNDNPANGDQDAGACPDVDAVPTRLPIDKFPHQPQRSGGNIPFTIQNLRHMLAGYGIDLRWDVIKKRNQYSQNGKTIAQSDIISLANLNGLYHGRIDDFLNTIAQENPVNPAKQWIESVPWDGKDRLTAFQATVKVQPDFPQSLADILLRRWLLSVVAAALSETEFRSRGVLTLQGGQGIGKTSWIAKLVPPDLVKLDHHLDASNKDSILLATGHWIVEIGELDSSFRKDVARLKGFLTAPHDKIRPPYGRSAIEMGRRTVFAASVNDSNFLVDQTGNSRWWTIPCEKLDFQHEIDLQQVFAQLAKDYRQGEQWWLTPDEEAQLEEQNKRFQWVSVIEEQILERAQPDGQYGKYMTARQVLIELGFSNPTNAQCKEAGAVLRSIYGEPKRVNGRTQWKVYLRSSAQVWHREEPDPNEY